ncbi:polyamine ABC transporter substrate-binding protein [Enhygromyxa salina]|uniref:Spermidine/putrescine-binding periplasmic protein n=1 Tax=Enhygromyxa salina TaxID=215803 RepID=A0A2S9YWV1_9BACT|nr:spermidine/putrescine ABC transporter substrate-binding protein [Enhygromyxa salina]PRQ09576.1 Spermidine/putrescine-binding periplasmic protein precursor [Enhygromyxa salina]
MTSADLSRRSLLAGLACLGLGLASCSRSRGLSVYNWGDYLAAEVIERFVKAHAGTRVTQDFYLSEAEMDAKLRAGARYDLVIPIDYLLSSLQRDGVLRELSAAPRGVEHLDPAFPVWHARDERGGGAYAVPYLWGTTGIGYDADRVDPPTSWNALFDPRYAGRISVIDSKGDVMDQALLASGLGINSTDKPAIREQVWPRLREQKRLLRAYDSNPAAALITGDTWIAQIDSGDLFRAQSQRPSLRYVIPDEGAALWIDYLAIPAKAANPELALAFIEFLLDPEIAALNANTLRFATPNATALTQGSITDAGDPQLYPPADVRQRLFTSENWDGGTKDLVDELWLELRSS